jgi:hypothetical protein
MFFGPRWQNLMNSISAGLETNIWDTLGFFVGIFAMIAFFIYVGRRLQRREQEKIHAHREEVFHAIANKLELSSQEIAVMHRFAPFLKDPSRLFQLLKDPVALLAVQQIHPQEFQGDDRLIGSILDKILQTWNKKLPLYKSTRELSPKQGIMIITENRKVYHSKIVDIFQEGIILDQDISGPVKIVTASRFGLSTARSIAKAHGNRTLIVHAEFSKALQRRKYLRKAYREKIHVVIHGKKLECYSLDISRGGIKFRSAEKIGLDEIEIQFPKMQNKSIRGKIIGRKGGNYQVQWTGQVSTIQEALLW